MADKKLSQESSLTKATVATNDLIYTADVSANTTKSMTYQEMMQPTDANFRIAGSSDNTKLVAFEVDGLTTATTRTVTIPDADTTMVGTGLTQTLTNKTLSTGTTFNGYNKAVVITDASGVASALTGTSGQIVSFDTSNVPVAIANPSAADASTTVKGVVEIATTAEISAGTSTGATGGVLVVPADAVGAVGASKLVQFTAATKYPAADGSLITNIAAVASLGAVAPVTVSSSTTATDLLSVSIPANTLGTASVVRFYIPFWKIKKVGTGNANAIQVKYGSTTLITINPDNNAATYTDDVGHFEGYICGNAATNSQRAWLFFKHGQSNTSSTTVTAFESSATGTAAEDSTTTLTFKVVWTNGTNSANDYIFTMPGVIEKIA